MKKYRASFYGGYPSISKVEINRETEHCVFLPDNLYGERRYSKESSCECFVDSLEEARTWVMDKIQIEMAHKKVQAEAAQESLVNLAIEVERVKTMEAE
jgi:hypothetical protein